MSRKRPCSSGLLVATNPLFVSMCYTYDDASSIPDRTTGMNLRQRGNHGLRRERQRMARGIQNGAHRTRAMAHPYPHLRPPVVSREFELAALNLLWECRMTT